MLSIAYLLLSLVGAWLVYNVFRPNDATARMAAFSWVTGWLTAELALHHIVFWALVTLGFAWAGAFAGWPGQLGLWVTMASLVALGTITIRATGAGHVVEAALRDGLGDEYRSRIPKEAADAFPGDPTWREIALPFPIRHPDVERIRDIPYRRARGLDVKLDVYRPRRKIEGAPVLFEIHGGGWIVGSKNEQGLPLMVRMARQGWVCVTADYRLSPHATFPDHLIDLKDALRWIREHVAEYGGDPDFVVVTGQSAGGHLASLVALTANDPEYQPEFESADTSVVACVPFYGVYDFTNRFQHYRNPGLSEVLETKVMKASLDEDPEAYRKASPIDRIGDDVPPFFVIHGDADTLVPVAEARRFVAKLREASKAPVVYAELPGAQHAFELFPSFRTIPVLVGIERFLAIVRAEHVVGATPGEERARA